MRKTLIPILMLIPTLAFAAGGYIGPVWLTVLMDLFLIPSLFLFFYIGYLSFWVAKENRTKFISLYVLILLCSTAFIASTAHLVTHENIAWVESVCLLTLILVPMLMAYATYKLNSLVIGEKHSHMLRNSWYAALASISLVVLFPFFLMTIQMMFPFMQFYL